MPVAMVIVGEHYEDTLLAEERRLAMRELLPGVGQRQIDPADALELPLEGFWVLLRQRGLAADCRQRIMTPAARLIAATLDGLRYWRADDESPLVTSSL